MAVRVEDIEYNRPNGVPLLATVYHPEGPGPHPAVLEVHGGAWTGGDRFNNRVIAEDLAANGILVASIDFRMPPVAGYPDTLADVNFGVRWLKANAASWGSRADLVGGLGTSSGGHMMLLTLLRPTDPRYAALPGAPGDAGLRYGIVCWPVADPVARYRAVKERGNTRLAAAHDAFWPSETAMAEGSPQHILDSAEAVRLPPVLIMQGTADNNLTDDMMGRLAASYARRGGHIESHSFPGQGHAFIPNAPTSPDGVRGLGLVRDFIRRHGV
jgi:acetyl esterase/lipase